MDLGVAFVAGAEPAKVVQVREAALDDPALPAEIGAVLGSAPGDDGLDAARPEQPPFLGAATSVMRSCWFVGGRGLSPAPRREADRGAFVTAPARPCRSDRDG